MNIQKAYTDAVSDTFTVEVLYYISTFERVFFAMHILSTPNAVSAIMKESHLI